jgi:hypothetical protein
VVEVRKGEALVLFGLKASVGAVVKGCRVIKQGFGCPGLLQGWTKGLANEVLCGYNRCQEPLGIRTGRCKWKWETLDNGVVQYEKLNQVALNCQANLTMSS